MLLSNINNIQKKSLEHMATLVNTSKEHTHTHTYTNVDLQLRGKSRCLVHM